MKVFRFLCNRIQISTRKQASNQASKQTKQTQHLFYSGLLLSTTKLLYM